MNGIDHLLIRVDDHEPLFSLLTETFELPTPWPLSKHPSMASAGVSLGNLDIELVRFGPPESTATIDGARLFGLAFEPADLATAVDLLAGRGIPHSGIVPYVRRMENGDLERLWWSVYVGGLFERTLWERAFFAVTRTVPRGILGSVPTGETTDPRPLIDRVFPNGMVFLVEYVPAFTDRFGRTQAQREFRATGGGPLGIERVDEVIVGCWDFESTADSWKRLLGPATEVERGIWKISDEPPVIRLDSSRDPGVAGLVLSVTDLDDAIQFLDQMALLGPTTGDSAHFDPTVVPLDIQLREANRD